MTYDQSEEPAQPAALPITFFLDNMDTIPISSHKYFQDFVDNLRQHENPDPGYWPYEKSIPDYLLKSMMKTDTDQIAAKHTSNNRGMFIDQHDHYPGCKLADSLQILLPKEMRESVMADVREYRVKYIKSPKMIWATLLVKAGLVIFSGLFYRLAGLLVFIGLLSKLR